MSLIEINKSPSSSFIPEELEVHPQEALGTAKMNSSIDWIQEGMDHAVLLNGEYVFDEQYFQMLLQNTRTWAMEAATHGVIMQTEQYWKDGQFFSHGRSLMGIVEAGLDASIGQHNLTEQERRKAELVEEMNVRGMWYLSDLENGKEKLVISPFPEEMSRDQAEHLGYDPNRKIAMVRSHRIGSKGQKIISQLAIENSDTVLFSELLSRYGSDFSSELSSVELLETHLEIDSHVDGQLDSVVEIARQYDTLLEGKYDKSYFLGREVEEGEGGVSYDDLKERGKYVETACASLIEQLVQKKMSLVESVLLGEVLGSFADKQYAIEKIGVLGILMAQFDEKRAREEVGGEQIEKLLKNKGEDQTREAARIFIESAVVFYACGGSLQLGNENLLGDNKELYVWECEKCGLSHSINVPMGIYKDHCDACGASGKC